MKTRPLQREDLIEFKALFKSRPTAYTAKLPRWRTFKTEEVLSSEGCRLDLTWDVDVERERSELNRLDEISRLIAEDLQQALALVSKIQTTGSRS